MDAERGAGVARKVKEGTQFAILLFASTWGVYTFVYKETILPSRRPATLTVTTSLEELGRTDETVFIRLRVHAANRTDRRIYVPALWYNVEAFQLSKQAGELDGFRAQIAQAPQADIQSRFSAVTASDVVAVGTIYKTGATWFEPTQEDTTEVLFEVPLDRRYDALHVQSQCLLTKTLDGLELTGWDVGERGDLRPQLVVLGRPYDPYADAEQYAWAIANGAGYYDSISSLPLWKKPTSPPAPAASTDPRYATRPQVGLEN